MAAPLSPSLPPALHSHESWQIRDGGAGPYCAACGHPVPLDTKESLTMAETTTKILDFEVNDLRSMGHAIAQVMEPLQEETGIVQNGSGGDLEDKAYDLTFDTPGGPVIMTLAYIQERTDD